MRQKCHPCRAIPAPYWRFDRNSFFNNSIVLVSFSNTTMICMLPILKYPVLGQRRSTKVNMLIFCRLDCRTMWGKKETQYSCYSYIYIGFSEKIRSPFLEGKKGRDFKIGSYRKIGPKDFSKALGHYTCETNSFL